MKRGGKSLNKIVNVNNCERHGNSVLFANETILML